MPQQFIAEVDVGIGYLVVLVLGLGVARLVKPPAFSHHHQPGDFSSISAASSPAVTDSKEPEQFCCHFLKSDSPALTPPGPTLLSCPGEVQGLLTRLLRLVRVRTALQFSCPQGRLFCLLQMVRGGEEGVFTLLLSSCGIPGTLSGAGSSVLSFS